MKTKEGTRFLKEMKAAGYPADDNGLNGWISMQVLAKVADGLPEVTAPALFDKLNTTTGLVTGLMPPIAVHDTGRDRAATSRVSSTSARSESS